LSLLLLLRVLVLAVLNYDEVSAHFVTNKERVCV